MNHLDEGALRRLLDEPEAFGDAAKRHVETCTACSTCSAALQENAAFAARALAGEPVVDAARAYAGIRTKQLTRREAPLWYRPAAACAAAAIFVAALLFTPLGGYARSFLTVFEPQQFQAIDVTRADLRDLRLLPQANDIGTQRVLRKPVRRESPSIAAARKRVAFAVLAPSVLPPHFGVHAYYTYTPGEMTFTFSAQKARAFERHSGKHLPPMPAGLNGTSLRLQTGGVFNAHYEASGARGTHRSKDGTQFLEILEAQHPRVTSSGASLQTLEQYLLAMPNVSPRLAQQIRALGDIGSTLPVPVAIDKQRARSVTVQGVRGLEIGDNTGLGAGVLWEKNGIVYVVAGPVSMNDAIAVADGLR